ncbi:MAG: aminopeptidase [Candidatus Nanohaloarchaea archaeon]
MSLEDGASTVINQCMDVKPDETVLILNDGNDQDIIEALLDAARDKAAIVALKEYEEPENHGEEPPQEIADAMKDFDVVIAPTKKSLSHTNARTEACASGARVATMPGINKEVWNSSLQADYERVAEISEKVYSMMEDTDRVRIETPSGTDLEFSLNIDYFHTDTGLIHEPGEFGNLPAGESDGGVTDVKGTLVTDHFPFAPEVQEVEIKDNKAVAVKEKTESELSKAFENIEGARTVAEFGFGTNPEATLIGNLLQDEKVLGTVHIAFGDNTSYITGEGANECEIHWDSVCESPTVYFDDEKVLDDGEPIFLDEA